MYYVSNKGTFIKLEDISAIVPCGNMGLCEVHLNGTTMTMSDHAGLLDKLEQYYKDHENNA